MLMPNFADVSQKAALCCSANLNPSSVITVLSHSRSHLLPITTMGILSFCLICLTCDIKSRKSANDRVSVTEYAHKKPLQFSMEYIDTSECSSMDRVSLRSISTSTPFPICIVRNWQSSRGGSYTSQ